MNVYIVEGVGGYFFLGHPDDPTFDERTRLEINRRQFADSWSSVSFGWDRDVKPKPERGRPDVCLGCGGLLISAAAVPVLLPNLSDDWELLPILIEDEPWYLVNVLRTTQAYDPERSDFRRFSSEGALIFSCREVVLTDPALLDADVFTLEDSTRGQVFVTETFKRRIERAGIGYAVRFREVGCIDESEESDAERPRPQPAPSTTDPIHLRHAGLPAPTSPVSDRNVEPIMPTDEALDLLRAQQRPALQLVPAASAGWSQVGGRPTLPDDMAWPMGCEGPMAFLAQLDLADIPAAPVVLPGLPTTGCLYFFYDPDLPPDALDRGEGPGWQVIHVTQRPVAPPRDTPDALPDDLRFAAAAVGFRAIRTVPSFERIGVNWSRLADDNFDRFDELRDGAYGEHAFHQIGGYPANIQDDTMEEECQRAAESLFRRTGLDPAGWRLLLQVGSDETLGMMWGDGGNIYFWIHEEDLAQGEFSRVWVVVQSF